MGSLRRVEYPALQGHQNIAEYLNRKQKGTPDPADDSFEKLCKVAGLDPQELQNLLAKNEQETRNQLANRAGAVVTAEIKRLWKDRPLKIRFNLDAQHLDTFISIRTLSAWATQKRGRLAPRVQLIHCEPFATDNVDRRLEYEKILRFTRAVVPLLEKLLAPCQTIGIAWGGTLQLVISAFEEKIGDTRLGEDTIKRMAARAVNEGRGAGTVLIAWGRSRSHAVAEAIRAGAVSHLLISSDLGEELFREFVPDPTALSTLLLSGQSPRRVSKLKEAFQLK